MKAVIFVCALLLTAPVAAQEKLTLTTPVSQPSITDYQVNYIGISRSAWTLVVELKPSNTALPSVTCTWGAAGSAKGGLVCSTGYTSATAPANFASTTVMIQALNKANLSGAGNSLEARVYAQLVTDGAFAGSVTGSPQ